MVKERKENLDSACLMDHPTEKISKGTLQLIETTFKKDGLHGFINLDTRVDWKVDQSEMDDSFVSQLCKEGAAANRRCFALGTDAAEGTSLVEMLD